jgi:hypothetical protein
VLAPLPFDDLSLRRPEVDGLVEQCPDRGVVLAVEAGEVAQGQVEGLLGRLGQVQWPLSASCRRSRRHAASLVLTVTWSSWRSMIAPEAVLTGNVSGD